MMKPSRDRECNRIGDDVDAWQPPQRLQRGTMIGIV
jgi:hypothetical protein